MGTGALCQTPLLFILMLLSDAGVEGWDLGDGLGGSASPLGCKEDLRGKNWGFCGHAGSFPSLKGPKIGCRCPMAQPSSSSLCQGLMLGLGMSSRGLCPPGPFLKGLLCGISVHPGGDRGALCATDVPAQVAVSRIDGTKQLSPSARRSFLGCQDPKGEDSAPIFA